MSASTIGVRGLDGKKYEFDTKFDPTKTDNKYTVLDLRTNIANRIGESDVSNITKIIYNGKILKDTDNLATVEYIGKNNLVFMRSTKKPQPKKEEVKVTPPTVPVPPPTVVAPAPVAPAPVAFTPLTGPTIIPTMTNLAQHILSTSVAITSGTPEKVLAILLLNPQVQALLSSNNETFNTMFSDSEFYLKIMAEMQNIIGTPITLPSIPASLPYSSAMPPQFTYSPSTEIQYASEEDHDNIDSLLNNYTESEKKQLNNIVNLGYDIAEVIQIFEACGRNIDNTLSLLMDNSL